MKKILAPLALTISAIVFSGSSSFAETEPNTSVQNTYSTIASQENSVLPTATKIIITSNDGTQVLTLTDPTMSIVGFLENEGISARSLKTEDNELIGENFKSPFGKPLFLFKSEFVGSQERVVIPASVKRVKTDNLLIGERKVAQEGRDGHGITTTIIEANPVTNKKTNEKAKSQANNSYEMFTVVNLPAPKIIWIGTRGEDVDTEVSGVSTPTLDCSNGSSVPDDVDANIIAIHADVCRLFPEVTTYGTWRDFCTYTCDHHDGVAVDIMVSGELGWEVAEYLEENYEQYNISNMIYEQKIWATYRQTWTGMSDRGSATANHFDHVHVSVFRPSLSLDSQL